MAQQWYAQLDGRTLGPFPAKKLRDLANAGTLVPDTQLRIGDGAWFRATRVKGLFDATVAAERGFSDEPAIADSEYDWSNDDDLLDEESALAPPPIPGAMAPSATAAGRSDDGIPKYAVLRVYAILLIVVGSLPVAFSLVLLVLSLIGENALGVMLTLFWLAASLGFGLACFVVSELLHSVIQVSTDVRRSRNALERIERRFLHEG
ncbi:MAG: DUF4339 domain-containing protein [Planctomycetaceae bacterium]